MSIDVETVTAVVFLDRFERYAKAESEIAIVRCFTGTGCDYSDLTAAQFNALRLADRETLSALPGRPECIVTEGKSNA